jgi:hypothetical protein
MYDPAQSEGILLLRMKQISVLKGFKSCGDNNPEDGSA